MFSFWALADSGLEPDPAPCDWADPGLARGVVSGDIGGCGLRKYLYCWLVRI